MGRRSTRNHTSTLQKHRTNLERYAMSIRDSHVISTSPFLLVADHEGAAGNVDDDQNDAADCNFQEDDCNEEEEENSSIIDEDDVVNSEVGAFNLSQQEHDAFIVRAELPDGGGGIQQVDLVLDPQSPSVLLDINSRCMAGIYLMASKQGCSLEFIDDLFRVLRKNMKEDGFDITKAPLRSTLLKTLRLKLGDQSPPLPISVAITPDRRTELAKFSILAQIKDLMASTDFQILDNLVVNQDSSIRFQKYVTPANEDMLEVNSGQWYVDTYDEMVKDIENEWLFPLIFYIDKTGTDALQRFPLEPLMLTTSVLKRAIREKASAWRHVGFVPPCEDATASPEETMQYFHKCLEILLEDLIQLQRSPPEVQISINGLTVKKRLILPVAFVMGDQPSQDKHCGRKAAYCVGAGRIHRQCMTSSLSACSTSQPCCAVSRTNVHKLADLARLTLAELNGIVNVSLPNGEVRNKRKLLLFLKRRTKFSRMVLGKVYSMYPISNAWSNVCFGANKAGIYRASLDDPMHYSDSGAFLYLAQVTFLSMTQSERLEMEKIIKIYFEGKRSSVRDDLPRGKFSAGFTRTTLLTAGEKIGLIFSVFITLGTVKGALHFRKVLRRLQDKYEELPSNFSLLPKRGDSSFFSDVGINKKECMDRTLSGVKRSVQIIIQHGLSFLLEDCNRFDELQTEYLLQSVHTMLDLTSAQYPHVSIPGIYCKTSVFSNREMESATDLFNKLRRNPNIATALVPQSSAASPSASPIVKAARKKKEPPSRKRKAGTTSCTPPTYDAKSNIEKHDLVRPKLNGSGPTGAILTDLAGFRTLLAKALSFHSFVHYFEELPVRNRIDIPLITRSLDGFVNEYARCIYRGDDTSDCNTGKIHSHFHLGSDIRDYGHPMNWEAGKGERGLKVWAKMAGQKAQKQTLSTFTQQTARRVAESSLLTNALNHHTFSTTPSFLVDAQLAAHPGTIIPDTATDEERRPTVRRMPHFLLDWEGGQVLVKSVTVRGKEVELSDNPFNARVIKTLSAMEKTEDRNSSLQIWKDATIYLDGNAKKIRAFSVYDKYGQFYDWVSVQFDATDDRSCYPAKLLVIYMDRKKELSAIVHGCDWRNDGEKKLSTPLTTRWALECSPNNRVPILRKIALNTIVEVIYVIEHCPQIKESLGLNMPTGHNSDRDRYCVDVVEPRYMWAEKFVVEARVVPSSRNNKNGKRRSVSTNSRSTSSSST